jgi:predicted RND superfamily exporter protein
MKSKIIHLSLRFPRQTIVVTVLISLLLGSGIFNLRKSGHHAWQYLRSRHILISAKNIILFPFRVYISREINVNPEVFKLRIDDDILNMLPKDLPARIVWERLEETFGSTEFTLVIFGKKGRDIVNPGSLDKVRQLSNALEAIDAVDRVNSLSNLNKIEPDEGGFTVSPMIEEDGEITADKVYSIRQYLDKHPDIKSNFISENSDYASLMVVYRTEGVDEQAAARQVTDVVHSIIQDQEIVISGLPFLRGILAKNILSDLILLMPIVIIVLLFMLVVTLRTRYAIPLVIPVIVLTVLATLGLMGWFKQKFMMINASMPTILLTIACADSIHIISRFLQEIKRVKDQKLAVRNTMDALMLPVFLTSITTMAAFLTLTVSPITAMIPYGIFVSFGVAWAWLLSVTLLPARLCTFKPPEKMTDLKNIGVLDRLVQGLGRGVCAHPKTVLAAGIGVIIVSLAGIFRVQIEVNFNTFFPDHNPISVANRFVDKHLNGVMNISFEVQGDIKDPKVLKTMRKVSDRLEQFPNIRKTMSLSHIIAKMNRAINDDRPEHEIIPDTRNQVAQLLELYAMSGDPSDFENLVNYEYTSSLINATMNSISTNQITKVIEEIENYVNAFVDPEMTAITATGFSVFLRDFVGLVIKSSIRSVLFSVIIVFLIGLLFFRSVKWSLVAILPLTSAIILNFGLMGYLGIDLSHITALMISIIIGVGIDFAMHFIAHARALIRKGANRDMLVYQSIDDVGRPIIINAVSIAFGFSVLLFSNFIPIRFLGALVGISMISCAFGALTIMASIVYLLRKRI